MVSAAGETPLNAKGESITKGGSGDLTIGFGGTVVDEKVRNVITPDGRPLILTADGKALLTNGQTITDKKGSAIGLTADGKVTDSTGVNVLGADGKALVVGKLQGDGAVKINKVVLIGPDGKPIVMGLNGQLYDSKSNALVSAAGKNLYLDAKNKKVVDASGKAVAIDKKGKVAAKSQALKVETAKIAA